MVNTIQIEHALHNNRVKVFIKFEYDSQTIELAKTLTGIKWSHSHKVWYVGYHPNVMSQINRTFIPKGIKLNLINTLDDIDLLNCKKTIDSISARSTVTNDN